jgi:hypothetical protein
MVIAEDDSNKNIEAITLGTVQLRHFTNLLLAIYDPIIIII